MHPRALLLPLASAFACLGLAASTAFGQTLSWTTTTAQSANSGSGSLVVATEFQVSEARTVTHLGYYDDTFLTADGLSAAHPVALFIRSSGQQLASATVPSGVTAPKVNQFRMVALSQPVALQPGTVYVVAAMDGGDPTVNVSKGTSALAPASGLTIGNWLLGTTSVPSVPTLVASTTTINLGPVVGFGPQTIAGAIGWRTDDTTASANQRTGTVGIEFAPTRPVRVRALGVYDDTAFSGPGLAFGVPMALYDMQTQQSLVGPLLVPAGTNTPLVSGFRFAQIPAPSASSLPILAPGRRYSVVMQQDQNGDATRNIAQSSLIVDPRIRLISWRLGPNTLGFPDFPIAPPSFQLNANVLLEDACAVDMNASGARDVDDIFLFLNLWFAMDPAGNFDRVGGITIDDIFLFLNAWFAGC